MIFGHPRSGTKLLAKIHQSHGYHNFGEFFNAFSSEIVEDIIPYAVRASRDDQIEQVKLRKELGSYYDDYKHSIIVRDRYELFKRYNSVSPTVVTVWEATFQVAPETFELTKNRFVLCTRRANRFEQLLSRCVTKEHLNHDGEIESTPITVAMSTLEYYFRVLTHVESLQDQIVSMGRGAIIDFDDLIAGTVDLGFEYTVETQDQHTDLKSLIINIDEVTERFNYLVKKYNKTDWT